MKMVQAVRALGPIDARSVVRDPLLRWMVFYPLLMAALIRWGVPVLEARLRTQYGFSLAPYYVLLMSFALLMSPMLTGMIIGFLLLDQRDDQTLTALRVTPLSLNGYLVYRLSLPMAISLIVTFIVFPLAGLLKVGFATLLLAGLSAAPLAPFYALLLAGFAENKVQGFALIKALGVLMVPPVMAYFVPAPWQWAFGVDPLYWPAKLLWMLFSGERGVWAYFSAGLLYQGLLLLFLLRRFNKEMNR
jgi:fluoroquinolone transport system permease protein